MPSTKSETADYIRDLSVHLHTMAFKAGFETTAYLLHLVVADMREKATQESRSDAA